MSEMWPESAGKLLHNLLGGGEPEPGPPYVHTLAPPEPIGELEDGTPIYPEPGPAFTLTAPRCAHCRDEGHVCEDHPDKPWEGIWGTVEGHAEHGGIGMPCPACCTPIPRDGTALIAAAFVPDWKRGL